MASFTRLAAMEMAKTPDVYFDKHMIIDVLSRVGQQKIDRNSVNSFRYGIRKYSIYEYDENGMGGIAVKKVTLSERDKVIERAAELKKYLSDLGCKWPTTKELMVKFNLKTDVVTSVKRRLKGSEVKLNEPLFTPTGHHQLLNQVWR